MKKRIAWLVIGVLLLAGGVWYLLSDAPSDVPTTRAEEYRYKPLDILTAHIVRMEKSNAKSIYLADATAERYRPYLEHAGLTCATNAVDGRYKLVLGAGSSPDWQALLDKTAEHGVVAYALNIRDMTAAHFQKLLKDCPCADVRLWMPGEYDWILTARREASPLKLDVLLDAFLPDGAMDDLAVAHCEALPQLFASYVGTREELLPAFQGDLKVPIAAAALIPVEVPTFTWLMPGEADADIYTAVQQELRSFQVVRRLVVEGNLLAAQPGGIEAAIDKWFAAHQRNPHDMMLLDRLYRLAVNARAFENVGNLKGAAACYETMISVRPKDAAAMARYAECMRQLGYTEIAEAAAQRARELVQ